jgi:hypothetical protein
MEVGGLRDFWVVSASAGISVAFQFRVAAVCLSVSSGVEGPCRAPVQVGVYKYCIPFRVDKDL